MAAVFPFPRLCFPAPPAGWRDLDKAKLEEFVEEVLFWRGEVLAAMHYEPSPLAPLLGPNVGWALWSALQLAVEADEAGRFPDDHPHDDSKAFQLIHWRAVLWYFFTDAWNTADGDSPFQVDECDAAVQILSTLDQGERCLICLEQYPEEARKPQGHDCDVYWKIVRSWPDPEDASP